MLNAMARSCAVILMEATWKSLLGDYVILTAWHLQTMDNCLPLSMVWMSAGRDMLWMTRMISMRSKRANGMGGLTLLQVSVWMIPSGVKAGMVESLYWMN